LALLTQRTFGCRQRVKRRCAGSRDTEPSTPDHVQEDVVSNPEYKKPLARGDDALDEHAADAAWSSAIPTGLIPRLYRIKNPFGRARTTLCMLFQMPGLVIRALKMAEVV
jgi:hypothetical protein